MADEPQQAHSIAPTYPPSGPRATFGVRLGAFLIDVVLLYIVAGLIGLAFGEHPFAFTGTSGFEAEAATSEVSDSVFAALWILYFWALEGSGSGQTLGKKLLGIRVVDYQSGAPIRFGRGLLRCFGHLLSVSFCFLGYLWMLWDDDGQTWHDKMARTTVVPTSAFPVERGPAG
jgi:uncharacterized RDD family membrane protein YckC